MSCNLLIITRKDGRDTFDAVSAAILQLRGIAIDIKGLDVFACNLLKNLMD